jgi:hypothetical protein
MAPSKMLQILMQNSWIQQESSFTQIPLEQVIAERQYDIKLKWKVSILQNFYRKFYSPTKNCASSSYNSIEIKLQD